MENTTLLQTSNVSTSKVAFDTHSKFEQDWDDTSAPSQPTLFVKKLSENATLPLRASEGAAGYDLFVAEDCTIYGRRRLIATDIAIAIPRGYYGRIAPRSSLAWKHCIDVGAGVIDEDYRGPIGVLLCSSNENPFYITKGDRIAQLIITKIITPEIVEVNDLDDTERGSGGFGSSGTR